MNAAYSVAFDSLQVLASAIAFVAAEPVLWELVVILLHESVAGDLCDNGSSGDAQAALIAADDRALRHGQILHRMAVHEGEVYKARQSDESLACRAAGGVQDVDFVDYLRAYYAHSKSRALADNPFISGFPARGRERLGIANPLGIEILW